MKMTNLNQAHHFYITHNIFNFFKSVLIFVARNNNTLFLMFQGSWEKRILKSLNSMCTELSIPLARKVLFTLKYFIPNQVLGRFVKL